MSTIKEKKCNKCEESKEEQKRQNLIMSTATDFAIPMQSNFKCKYCNDTGVIRK